jgi:hypothetical protein
MEKRNKQKEKNDFLKEVYRLRIQLYGEFSGRMWTRFNFLLTAEIGVAGFFIANSTNSEWNNALWLFPVVGGLISLIWYILGAQDRYYFEGFRMQVQHLENKITEELGIEDVGMFAFGNPTNVKKDLFTWRWRFISLSRLVAALPLFFLFFWAVILWFMLNAG